MNRARSAERAAVADLIRWGPTIGGVVIAATAFATFNALWLALAYESTDNWWRDNLEWLVGGTAAGSLLLAGLLAGLMSGVRGVGAGLVNGATAWGLLFLLSLSALIPGAFNLITELGESLDQGISDASGADLSVSMWTAFWSLLAGAGLALLGGAIGGAVHRRVVVPDAATRPAGRNDGDPEGDVAEASAAEGRVPDGTGVDQRHTIVLPGGPGAETRREHR